MTRGRTRCRVVAGLCDRHQLSQPGCWLSGGQIKPGSARLPATARCFCTAGRSGTRLARDQLDHPCRPAAPQKRRGISNEPVRRRKRRGSRGARAGARNRKLARGGAGRDGAGWHRYEPGRRGPSGAAGERQPASTRSIRRPRVDTRWRGAPSRSRGTHPIVLCHPTEGITASSPGRSRSLGRHSPRMIKQKK